ncbi:MAG: NAD-dependent epimerase/dehydratase family protein [Chitinophagaceae bacterium]|jgi:dihydroflavonol-4-reductase|nr:NAD-dependent epimerase/dehydratase family protein [Chitinophagaceae bacterium]MBP9740342.1 NAD-dependent epimerase/dehydratase family protein [Chitinophagaceae bacterium]
MILVTGSTGLVGTHLIQQLLQNKQPIKAFFRSEIPFEHSLVQWVKADILDVVALEEAMQNVTQVYHCAAIVSFNPKQKNELHKTNIEGTANVVNACLNAQVQKLLFVSSVAALGRIREDKPIDETMNWTEETSNSEYGKTKFLAEMEVWRGIGEGLNAVIVNPTIILGNGDWNKGSSSVFKSVYNEFPWYTEGTTGFVDVLDVVEAMIQLMNSNIVAQRFILSAETSTYKDLFTLIANAFNKKPPSKLVTPFIAAVVWRLEAFKAKFSGKQPLLTKETAKTAQAKVSFNNQKLLQYLPSFSYTSLPTSIQRICKELKQTHGL